jgi:hypothetical protein
LPTRLALGSGLSSQSLTEVWLVYIDSEKIKPDLGFAVRTALDRDRHPTSTSPSMSFISDTDHVTLGEGVYNNIHGNLNNVTNNHFYGRKRRWAEIEGVFPLQAVQQAF